MGKMVYFIVKFVAITLVLFGYAKCQDGPTVEYKQDICVGKFVFINCTNTPTSNYTAVIREAIYGINALNESACEYSEADCYDVATTSFCITPTSNCSAYAFSYEILLNCNKKIATYLHLRYRCLPADSISIPYYDVCSNTKDITDSKAFISSPGYPVYTMVPNDCIRKIVVPDGKTINMWFISIDMKSPDSSFNCPNDYIKITDNTATYTLCGNKKYALENKLCSSVIYVQYRAPANLYPASYRGFRLYYEIVDRNPQNNCSTSTPSPPTTLQVTTTTPQAIFSLAAYETKTVYVCKQNQTSIIIPKDYILFPIESFYGVTTEQKCTNINPQNCKSPMELMCSFRDNCTISFDTNVMLPDCSNRNADYIGLKYRFIPLISTINQTICDLSDIDGTLNPYGIITSVNYPDFLVNQNCARKIIAPPGKVIRVSISDINIEPEDPDDGQCKNGFLSLSSQCNSVRYCGEKKISGTYVYTSCTDFLEIEYASTTPNLDLRGFNLYYEVVNPDNALNETKLDICPSSTTATFVGCQTSATTNYTAVLTTAFYGVQTSKNSSCTYSEGDCYEESNSNYCPLPTGDCYIYPVKDEILTSCSNKTAEYLHVRYRCIPISSAAIPNYDICDNTLKDITDYKAFISSPNYPVYTIVPTECVQKIVAPNDKIINIWFPSIDMKSPTASLDCPDDFVKITDTTGTYKVCGYRKASFEKTLCSSVVYVSYKAPSNLIVTSYKGFRLYYEFVDRSTQPSCQTNTPTYIPSNSSTTKPPLIVADLAASTIYKQYICRNDETTIQVPWGYQLFPIKSYYGVTSDETCDKINPQNCKTPFTLNCKLDENCKISLYNEIPVSDCGGKNATYIGIEYRFIPLYTTRNYSICDSNDIGSDFKYGVLTQPNYPNWEPSKDCRRRIIGPVNTHVRVYISDINIEQPDSVTQECRAGYLSIDTGCQTIKYCGEKYRTGSYEVLSCSNTMTISYLSSATQNLDYRGFNAYVEVESPEKASPQYKANVCVGFKERIRCDSTASTSYTIVVNEAFYGVKTNKTSDKCAFEEGDCISPLTSDLCTGTGDYCSVYHPYFIFLSACENKETYYLYARYQCIPAMSTLLNTYNICDNTLGPITDASGFIYSPNYPSSYPVVNECIQKISAPSDKIINVWFPDVHMKTPDSNDDCKTDYVRVIDSTGVYKLCGEKKYSFESRLCSSEIYITYKAPAVTTAFRGFAMYWEFVDRSTQPSCPTATPTIPTPPSIVTIPVQIVDLTASNEYTTYVCKGTEKEIEVPFLYVLFKINVYYGYTSDTTCATIDTNDCTYPAPLQCLHGENCTIAFYNDVEVDVCDGETPNYIGAIYRFIPLYTSRNFSVCDNTPIDGSVSTVGVITSPNYPHYQSANTHCEKIINVPPGYVFRSYLTDLNTDQANDCRKNFLAIESKTIHSIYCGDNPTEGSIIDYGCSGAVKITYGTSDTNNLRGFNLYFEIISDEGFSCPKITTTQKPTTKHITIVNNDIVAKKSKHLTAWSLGIGLPLIVLIVLFIFLLLRRTKRTQGDHFEFSRMNTDINDSKTNGIGNRNFS